MSRRGKRPPPDIAYVLPRHPTEAQRLDLEHHVLKFVIEANFKAPIGQPGHVLDVGCGTGQWPFEIAREFPAAHVVGFDLVPHPRRGPGNYRFVRGNLLHGLPFNDASFDFVHQRQLVSGIPVRQWPTVVPDLVRVTRPGGWVELVEAATLMDPEGPASARLMTLIRRLASTKGLDSVGHVIEHLGRYLTDAGCVDVQVRTMRMPVGEWGGPVGSWRASIGRAVFLRLAPVFEARFGLPAVERHQLIAEMLDEFEHFQPTTDFRRAYGRRPLPE